MKKISLPVLLFVWFSCGSKYERAKVVLNDKAVAKYAASAQNVIVLTCTSCGYVNSALRRLDKKDKEFLQRFTIIGDTNCIKLGLPAVYLNQSQIDSISYDIYNVTLVKKVGDMYEARVIETAESDKFMKVVKAFYGY